MPRKHAATGHTSTKFTTFPTSLSWSTKISSLFRVLAEKEFVSTANKDIPIFMAFSFDFFEECDSRRLLGPLNHGDGRKDAQWGLF